MTQRWKRRWSQFALISLSAQVIPAPLSAGSGKPASPIKQTTAAKLAPSKRGYRVVVDSTTRLTSTKPVSIDVQGLKQGRLYTLTVSLDPTQLRKDWNASVQIAPGSNLGGLGKTLHLGDPDLTLVARSSSARDDKIVLTAANLPAGGLDVRVQVVEWPDERTDAATVCAKPNSAQQPVEFTLGKTVFGSGDLTPYIPQEVPETTSYVDATRAGESLSAAKRSDPAEDWLRFTLPEGKSKLVYFELDLPERDFIPPDVSVYTKQGEQMMPFDEGADPVTPPHEVQALPGNKFTTRVLKPGIYYVRVIANHPEWRLKTQVMDAPPYDDPRKAVRAAIDYLLGAGDSWHANTPRSGSRLNRVSNQHSDAAQCVACHPTHFSTRGVVYAMANGYSPERKESLRFLTERLANNPRPFYGHPEATWARMISAAANVTGRLADLVDMASKLTGDRPASNVQVGAYNYLKLYYKGRTELPEDETNGNVPLVSQYEVLYHAWNVVNREAQRPGGDPDAAKISETIKTLLAQKRHRQMIDLCWQMVAMAKIDKSRYSELLIANTRYILSLQRPDGSWTVPFNDPKAGECEYQTAHALYALAVNGFKPDHPQIAKGVQYLLAKQRPFGGWFQETQPYENFRTPFRETQFAVMALSELYPENGPNPPAPFPKGKGEKAESGQGNSPHDNLILRPTPGVPPMPKEPLATLDWLDRLDSKTAAAYAKEIAALLDEPEPILRHSVALALGKAGDGVEVDHLLKDGQALKKLVAALGDTSKLVQRSAAVALRRLISEHHVPASRLQFAEVTNQTDRQRWGTARVYTYHAREFGGSMMSARTLAELAKDPNPMVRVQALQALWQIYAWTGGGPAGIDAAFAIGLAIKDGEHPWVIRNAREGIYNIADENVRYLYNNWIALLADPADREKAAAGQRLADELVVSVLRDRLEKGSPFVRAEVLRGLSEFHLRTVRGGNQRYGRIANDVETTRFAPNAAVYLEPEIIRALADKSPEVRKWAAVAAFTLRDAKTPKIGAALLHGAADENEAVRANCTEIARAMPSDVLDPKAEGVSREIAALLASEREDSRRLAIGLLQSKAGAWLIAEAEVKQSLTKLTANTNAVTDALSAMALVPETLSSGNVVSNIVAALKSQSANDKRSALTLAVTVPAARSSAPIRDAVEALIAKDPQLSHTWLVEIAKSDAGSLADSRVTGALADVLSARGNEKLQADALEAVKKQPTAQKAPAIRAALQSLSSETGRIADTARAILAADNGKVVARIQPDEAYFRDKVLPLFAVRSGADGQACVACHFNHSMFRVTPPNGQTQFSPNQMREAYISALKVVDVDNPERSPLLRKPISNAAAEGVVGAASHGGGPRWSGTNDPAYRAVLDWIQGAKLNNR